MGFLSAKNFESWTLSAASAYHYIDLPTDRVIRKMLIQGYLAAYEPWYQVLEARLSEDNDKRVPFDLELEDYYRFMKGIWAPVQETFVARLSTTEHAFYVTPTDYYASILMTPCDIYYVSGDAGAFCRGGYQLLQSNSANVEVCGVARGYLPNHCFEIPFGDSQDIEDLQQLRSY
jgi:hypothetical protein